jgi:hypothetical protein
MALLGSFAINGLGCGLVAFGVHRPYVRVEIVECQTRAPRSGPSGGNQLPRSMLPASASSVCVPATMASTCARSASRTGPVRGDGHRAAARSASVMMINMQPVS